MMPVRSEVEAIRNGEVVKLSSAELVPGDVIVLQPGTLPADVVLLRGECIVDENMLTGATTLDHPLRSDLSTCDMSSTERTHKVHVC